MTGLPRAAGEAVLHAHRAREARDRRRRASRARSGLIGLHIAQKTPSRPQWIWSSFEQKDAVPPKWADWPGAFVLNDGNGAPMPETQSAVARRRWRPEPVPPFNVVRDADAPILTRHRADAASPTSSCSPARRGSTTGWS